MGLRFGAIQRPSFMPGELSRCVISPSLILCKMVLKHLVAGMFPQRVMIAGGL